MPVEYAAGLTGSLADAGTPGYETLKEGLAQLTRTAQPIRFAYLLGLKDGGIVFLADSEPADSPDYSPPGQVYVEESLTTRKPFLTGETVLSEPVTDRWGTWISVLVPVKNDAGSVIAVFGVDYPAKEWNANIFSKVLPEALVVLCVCMLAGLAAFGHGQYQKIKRLNAELDDKKAVYESVFEQAPVGIALMSDKHFSHKSEYGSFAVNPMFEKILGRAKEELAEVDWTDITHPDDLQADLEQYKRFKAGEIKQYEMEKRYLKPDGSPVWVNMIVTAHKLGNNENNHLCPVQDITKQKELDASFGRSKLMQATFIQSSTDMIYLKDENFRHLMVNKALEKFFDKDAADILGKTDFELKDEVFAETCRKSDEEAIAKRATVTSVEFGEGRVFEASKFPVPLDSGKTGVGAYIRDVTAQYEQDEYVRKTAEAEKIIVDFMFGNFTDVRERLDFALQEAIRITGSKYGYIYFYSEEKREFTLNSRTEGVMRDCAVKNAPERYPLEKTGIWGEAVRQRKALIVNDFEAENPLKKGFPEGHVRFRKYMTFPIFENDKIVAVIGFADKERDYTQNDLALMTVFMSSIWTAVKNKEREQENERLLEQTRSMFSEHDAVMLLIEPESGAILDANPSATAFYGYTKEELRGLTIQEINALPPEQVRAMRANAMKEKQKFYAVSHRMKDGSVKMVDVYASPIRYMGKKALYSVVVDASDREAAYARIEDLNIRDFLTGIYNRNYYERARKELDTDAFLPLSVIVADINGVRLINESYGAAAGDALIKETAGLLRGCMREGDVLARTGGDDFSILLPNTDRVTASAMLHKIAEACDARNAALSDEAFKISLSLGYGAKEGPDEPFGAAEQDADAFMRKRKLLERMSHLNATFNSIMATLDVKSHETETHARRIAWLTGMMAEKLGLAQQDTDNLRLFSLLHDIGKIGVPDSILNKPGRLTPDEWAVMQKHTVIGKNIAMTVPDLEGIAEYILCHHERWDGSGYPQGLKGEQIPLLSRILALADAFDAMTGERVYRDPTSREEALWEIGRCAGTQFDPELAKLFVTLPIDKEPEDKKR